MASFFGLTCFGQAEKMSFSELNNNENQQRVEEKIYVHTDRSFYLCGEILWFKAYLTNASSNVPLPISKVVYVEVFDKLHRPVLQSKIDMNNGSGSGSFYLPFSVSSGNYVIRAYTNLMKNFSADRYFEKNITIINTSKNLDAADVKQPVNYIADFFPEGGNMVNGLESMIAFKVTDNKNSGAQSEGTIVDQDKNVVANFKSLQFGMGHFSLKPESGKKYAAIINFKDGTSIIKELPEAYEEGYVMHVTDESPKELKISVEQKGSKNLISADVFIIIHNNSKIDFAQLLRMENSKGFLMLSKDSLKNGVSQITVFNSNKKPVCERLYFLRPKNKLLITTKADKENYRKRSKVLIQLNTHNQAGADLPVNLSAAVYRLDDLHSSEQENIYSYLWLTSNLKGNIQDPAYYFENDNAITNEALNNLMLTQGWRKFNPENSLPALKYVPEYAGHFITGKVINAITNRPASNIEVYLSVPGRRVQLRIGITDNAGLVHFEMKDFYGANQIVLQTNHETDTTYHIEILTPFSQNFSNNTIPEFHIAEKITADLLDRNIHMEVQNSFHQNDLQQILKPDVDSLPFYFNPYKTYLLSDYTRFTTMEEVLREYVTEVNVRKNGSKYRLATFNAPGFALRDMQYSETIFENNPLVLLDGVPVFEMNKIIAYDPLKVQKLEVVAQKYHLGTLTSEGILSFTTYKGNLEGFTLDPKDIVLDYEGLQSQRIFYSPQYETENEKLSRIPDFRELLFWTPELNTDFKGKGEFSFYTGDIPGRYLVLVQGLSSNGFAGSNNFIFNVE